MFLRFFDMTLQKNVKSRVFGFWKNVFSNYAAPPTQAYIGKSDIYQHVLEKSTIGQAGLGDVQRIVKTSRWGLICRGYLPPCQKLSVRRGCIQALGFPVWAWEHCRISPLRFLAQYCMRRLNQASFVLLYFVLFAFSGLSSVFVACLFLICLLSCIFQRVPTWMALYSLIVLTCREESTHSLTQSRH